ETMSGGSDYYHGSAFLNINFQRLIIRRYGFTADDVMFMSMAIGLVICVALSFMLRHSDDWIEKLIPAILIAPMWTYTVPHDLAIWTVPAVWFLVRKTRGKTTRTIAVSWTIAVLLMTVAAVACYRNAWDWFKVWSKFWQPVFAERLPDIFRFPHPVENMRFWRKNFDKGLGYGYKQIILAAFIVWTSFRAWRMRRTA
ncbi:MAG: hypothetical protein FWG05_06290, partial [Kiritimatiellaeota bacterium]|nr:hypothetical protein [Kiritimatiellota bacterium]